MHSVFQVLLGEIAVRIHGTSAIVGDTRQRKHDPFCVVKDRPDSLLSFRTSTICLSFTSHGITLHGWLIWIDNEASSLFDLFC